MNFVYRIFSSFLLLILLVSFSFAQNPIPNPGFENWTGGNPNTWITSNIPGIYSPITQSMTSHSGTYAAKGEVLNLIGFGLPPAMISDTSSGGFSISQNYTRMTGYYQFNNIGQDVLIVAVILVDAQSAEVAGGGVELGATSGGYSQFVVDLSYEGGSDQPAANAYIVFGITTASSATVDTITVGSYFLIDDLEFDNVSNISEGSFGDSPKSYHLTQNYPNPFNPSTKINFSIPQSGRVSLTVFNSIGQEVETLIDKDMTAGDHQVTFNAGNLPSGIYFYRIEAGEFQDVKKMVLLR